MFTTTAPIVRPIVLDYCESGDHFVPADELYPAQMDPAMGTVRIPSVCENCNDAHVAAYYG